MLVNLELYIYIYLYIYVYILAKCFQPILTCITYYLDLSSHHLKSVITNFTYCKFTIDLKRSDFFIFLAFLFLEILVAQLPHYGPYPSVDGSKTMDLAFLLVSKERILSSSQRVGTIFRANEEREHAEKIQFPFSLFSLRLFGHPKKYQSQRRLLLNLLFPRKY